jgi:hypothetical protein
MHRKCLAARVAARSCRVFEQGYRDNDFRCDVPRPVTRSAPFSQNETQGDLATGVAVSLANFLAASYVGLGSCAHDDAVLVRSGLKPVIGRKSPLAAMRALPKRRSRPYAPGPVHLHHIYSESDASASSELH